MIALPNRRIRSITFAIIALFTTVAVAADDWVLTTVDFNTRRVTFSGIDASQLKLNGQKQLPLDQFLLIRRANVAARDSGTDTTRMIVRLHGGDRIVGFPVGTAGESIRWQSPTLGELKLPIKKLTSIERMDPRNTVQRSAADAKANEPATDDVIHLTNGDTLRGVVVEMNNNTVSVQPAGGGDPSPVQLSSVASIVFANTAATTRPAARQLAVQISLTDSTVITAATALADAPDGQITLTKLSLADAGDPPRSMPMSNVVSIEQINGPVVWLSNLSPVENVQTSFLDLAWPTRFDQSVSGGAIRFAEKQFAHGIGVHSYSRLAFAVDDPSLQTFRTQYAIDANAPLADVTVRIKFDGKVIHEQTHVRGGAISPVVALPLNGAKAVTLEVDYGDNQDVQDRLNWIEPAFLRAGEKKN